MTFFFGKKNNNKKKEKNMNEQQYINIRVESVTTQKNEELIRHCLRSKKEVRAISDNDNVLFINNERLLFKRDDYKNNTNKKLNEITKKLLQHNLTLINKQKNILKKNGKYLNTKRTNQVLSGVITFSDSIVNKSQDELREIEKAAQKTLEDICKKYNTKLHYLVFHRDEKGLPHFHFSVDNFDNFSGLTFSKSKNFGSDLQDIAASHFSILGFKRGIKKDKNHNRKHLSIREFEEYQETKKANERLKEENKTLIEENKALKEEKETTRVEFMKLIEDIEEFVVEENQAQKTKKWVKLWNRYFNSDNVQKRENLVRKAKKYKEKLNKRKMRSV